MVELYKSLEVLVAREAAKDPKMDTLAAKVEANVKANAPVESGAFRKSIKRVSKAGKRGVKDRIIYSDDPAAKIIEYGYVTKKGKGKYVPGHHPFRKGLKASR